MDAALVVRSDAELISAVRTGDAAAFSELYERHATAAAAVARRYTNSTADADDVVADAFTAVYAALRNGNGPDEAFRAYLFTVVRRTATVRRDGARRVTPTDDLATLEAGTMLAGTAEEPALEGFERGVVARAFHSLPERWQAVLWHTEVEELTPAQIAPLLGLTANGVAALAYRAREGLRQAYLQQHLNDPLDPGCQAVASSLGSYVRGGLGPREQGKVEAHLDECGECRALVLELGDVNHGMRAVIAPLVLGLVGLGALGSLLPIGGAAAGAAGAAATTNSGAGQGTAGSGSGGPASGAVGSGGAGAAGGAAAAGAAGSGGAAAAGGGIAAMLAAAPAVAVAAVAAVIVVGAVALAVAMGLGDKGRDLEADPVPLVTSNDAAPGDEPSTSDPTGATPSDAPSSDPSVPAGPSAGPVAPPGPGPDPTTGPTGDPSSGPTTPPTGEPSSPPTTEPTTQPTAEPSTQPTSGPTNEPTSEPTNPPTSPDVVVDLPPEGLVLAGGGAGQELSVTLRNDGDLAAEDLVADLVVPEGVSIDEQSVAIQPAPSSRPLVELPSLGVARPAALVAPAAALTGPAADWTCRVAESRHARCALGALPGGGTALLTVRVSVDEGFDSDAAGVELTVSGDGIDYRPPPIDVHVTPSPARLALAAAQEPLEVVAGRERTVTFALRNAGRSTAAQAVADVLLPDGTAWTGTATGHWTCTRLARSESSDRPAAAASVGPSASPTAQPGDVGVHCVTADVPGRQAVPLGLGLTASHGSPDGVVELVLSAGRGPAGDNARVDVQVREPAMLDLTSAATSVTVAGGRSATTAFTVANRGELDAAAATLTVRTPAGLHGRVPTVAPAAAEDWTCVTVEDVVTCDGPALAAGASSDVELTFVADAGAVGDVGVLAAEVRAADADPGTLVVPVVGRAPVLAVPRAVAGLDADDTGEVAFSLTVTGDAAAADAADVAARVELPGNLVATSLPERCAADAGVVTCRWAQVAVGEVVEVLLPVRSSWSAATTATVRVSAQGADEVVARASVPARSGALAQRFATSTGGWDVTEAGAPVLTCDPRLATCATAQRGGADNNSQTMLPLDEARPAEGTPRAAVPVSSSTTVTVPKGREIAFAGLYWSAVRGPGDTWSGGLDRALVRGPGGAYGAVTGEVTERSDASGRRYYTTFADVTEQVRAQGPGTWSVADVAVSRTRTDKDPTYYGGWSLVVVYSAPGDAAVTVYDGGLWVGTATPPPAFRFAAPAGSSARIGVVGWEGDRGLTGDRLRLGGLCTTSTTDLVPLRTDGTTGSSGNAFDSSAVGWRTSSSLGVDAKGFVPTTLPCEVAELTPVTTGDQYLVGAITLRAEPLSSAAPTR